MTYSPIQNRAIALAGQLQALSLVNEIATSGYLNTRDFETCIQSLFVINPSNTIEVYNNISHLERGLSCLADLLHSKVGTQHKMLLSYAVGINNLTGQLLKKGAMLGTVSKRLEEANQKIAHFGISHDNTIANIADIYSTTISTFRYRIQVKGEYTYLQQKRVADQIRALLLAAIRASILWRQNGGGVINLLLSRNKLLAETQTLLEQSRKANLDQ